MPTLCVIASQGHDESINRLISCPRDMPTEQSHAQMLFGKLHPIIMENTERKVVRIENNYAPPGSGKVVAVNGKTMPHFLALFAGLYPRGERHCSHADDLASIVMLFLLYCLIEE